MALGLHFSAVPRMQSKTRFLIISFVILTLFGWSRESIFSSRSEDSSSGVSEPVPVSPQLRLIEYLDRIVQGEIASPGKARPRGLSSDLLLIPKELAEHYEVRLRRDAEGLQRFEVRAIPRKNSLIKQVIAINESFEVKSNERVPDPRSTYLRLLAMKHLRKVRDAQPGAAPGPEESVFRGYFSYEARANSQGQRIAVAHGIRHPVMGAVLEIGTQEEDGREVEQLLSELMEQSDQPASRAPAASAQTTQSQELEIIRMTE